MDKEIGCWVGRVGGQAQDISQLLIRFIFIIITGLGSAAV